MTFFQQELDEATLGFDEKLHQELGLRLRKNQWTLTIIEGLSGGELCYRLTQLSKGKPIITCGLICKTPLVWIQLAGVTPTTLREHGESSEETMKESIQYLKKRIKSDLYLAATGDASGTIAIGFNHQTEERYKIIQTSASLDTIRNHVTRAALMLLKQWIPASN